MPSLVIPDTVEVTIEWLTGVLIGANVLHVVTDTPADTAAIAGEVAGWVFGTYTGIVPASTLFTTVTARDISMVGGGATTENVNAAGTDPGSALPPNASMCVTLRTALNSGRGRGRVYTPPQVEAVVDDFGTILLGRRTDAIDKFGELITALAALGGGTALAVASRMDLVSRPVTNVTVDPVIDTQRRRLRN